MANLAQFFVENLSQIPSAHGRHSSCVPNVPEILSAHGEKILHVRQVYLKYQVHMIKHFLHPIGGVISRDKTVCAHASRLTYVVSLITQLPKIISLTSLVSSSKHRIKFSLFITKIFFGNNLK